ncbi:MAG: hypothetical protein ACI4I1_09425 [Oscillospiraceae bacterium]
MKKTLSIALCLLFIFCLVSCDSNDMPDNMDHNGINLINYPRSVKVDGEIIDTAGLIYEENPISFIGESGSHTLQIYITTDFIKKYIDSKMKYSDGEFTFRVNNNIITLTENDVKVENELFGTVYESEITAFYCSETLVVNANDISKIIGMSVFSHFRENDDDNYMKTGNLEFKTDSIGELYTDLIYDDRYHYYFSKNFERKKPNGKVIGVNLRGNYIYQNENGGYYIEANGVYYPIHTELAPTPDNE